VFGINVTNITGRDRRSITAPSRLAHDFFLVGSGGSFSSAGKIPFIKAQQYYWTAVPGTTIDPTNPFFWTDYLADSPPFSLPTIPSRTTYVGWMNNALSMGWDGDPADPVAAGHTPVKPSQIAAEDSRFTRWMGNIWLRQTRFVLAR